ncbi:MAG: nucleoside triphosphate pyrophosphohydrolase [Cyanobacteria bacterium P01_A01_bin.135]
MTSPPSTDASSPVLAALQALIDVVAQLRSPEGGCPWDLAQTPQSLIPYVIEEAYEVADALRQDDPAEIQDELGDLLLQVVLQAQIAQETERFTLRDVAEAITRKLIRRHPHVFGEPAVDESAVGESAAGEAVAADIDQVRQNWEAIKAEEAKAQQGDERLTPKLAKYGRSLPPLLASLKISKKAASAGFEWESVDGVWDKFHEELGEFEHALKHESKARQQSEIGDLLFTVVNLARWYGLDPSAALQGTNQRFVRRFAQVEAAAGQSLQGYSIEELERFWQAAKANDSVKSEE